MVDVKAEVYEVAINGHGCDKNVLLHYSTKC
jgi:hypothetical protein